MRRYRTHDEVEARAQSELRRLGLPLSTWDKVPGKVDGLKANRKANRHRGHRNRQTGRGGKKKG